MATYLCERCFPAWEEHEIYAHTPHNPCEQCGQESMPKFANTAVENPVHMFPRDPRSNSRTD